MILTTTAQDAGAGDGAGRLLSEPSDEPKSFTRSTAQYENHSEKYILKERNFRTQYAHVYSARLWTMRDSVLKSAKKKWGSDIPVRKLFELQHDERCIVVGTLFKHMQLKPSILKELSEDHALVGPPPKPDKYTEEQDELILEDELQRIVLRENIDIQAAVTGTVIAVLGKEPDDDRGKFYVEDCCYRDLPPQTPLPKVDTDKYVALISGLDLCGKEDALLGSQLMIDLLTGQLGDETQQEANAKVVRAIIAGNSLSEETQDKENLNKAKYLTKKTSAASVEAIRSLDDTLVQLSACMEVDLMPGEFDPVNFILPQQPLHRCMFPQANMYPTMKSVSNPYDCSIDGVRFLGTSGQPVSNIYKFSSLEDRLEILEKTLLSGHMAPTAPDTLGCYPYTQDDPFIMDACPHIYFVGNQPKFQSKEYKGSGGERVLLVTIPRFSQTQTIVLVNLRTLECQPMSFQTDFPTPDTQQSPEVDK